MTLVACTVYSHTYISILANKVFTYFKYMFQVLPSLDFTQKFELDREVKSDLDMFKF